MGTTARTPISARAGISGIRRPIGYFLLATGAYGSPALSETDFSPIVTVGTTYTDNVALSGSGLEQDDILLEISPGFLVEAEERRIDIYTEVSAQALYYSENSDANEIYGQADLDATVKIVPERLFLDATGSYGQQVVDPEQTFSFSNLALTNNRTDATQYSVGPRLTIPFANAYLLEAIASHIEVAYDDESLIDASGDEGEFTFGNLEAIGSFAWEVHGESQRIEYEVGPEIEYQQAAFRARLGSNSLAFLGLIGVESDYKRPSDGGLEDDFWEAALAWNGSNHAVEAGIGERSFGDTYRLDLSMQFNSFAASMGYSQNPSTSAQVQLQRLSFTDTEIDRLLDRPGTTQRFVRELFQADIVFPTSDGAVTLSGSSENRTQRFSLVDGEQLSDEKLTTLTADWNRELGLRTAVNVYGSWARRDFGNQLGQDDVYQLSANLVYRFGRRTTILLRYSRTEQDSEGVSNRDDYSENLVSVYLTWTTSNSGTRLRSGRPRRSFD